MRTSSAAAARRERVAAPPARARGSPPPDGSRRPRRRAAISAAVVGFQRSGDRNGWTTKSSRSGARDLHDGRALDHHQPRPRQPRRTAAQAARDRAPARRSPTPPRRAPARPAGRCRCRARPARRRPPRSGTGTSMSHTTQGVPRGQRSKTSSVVVNFTATAEDGASDRSRRHRERGLAGAAGGAGYRHQRHGSSALLARHHSSFTNVRHAARARNVRSASPYNPAGAALVSRPARIRKEPSPDRPRRSPGGHSQGLRRPRRGARPLPRHPAGQRVRPAGPERRRQDHHAAHGHGRARARRGDDRDPRPAGRPAGRDRVGYMPEERGLYPRMVVEEQLLYFAELKGVPRRDAARAARTAGWSGWASRDWRKRAPARAVEGHAAEGAVHRDGAARPGGPDPRRAAVGARPGGGEPHARRAGGPAAPGQDAGASRATRWRRSSACATRSRSSTAARRCSTGAWPR